MICVKGFKHGNDPDKKFNPVQLRMGIKVEMEHTNDPNIAKKISKAHLVEDKFYYSKLKRANL